MHHVRYQRLHHVPVLSVPQNRIGSKDLQQIGSLSNHMSESGSCALKIVHPTNRAGEMSLSLDYVGMLTAIVV